MWAFVLWPFPEASRHGDCPYADVAPGAAWRTTAATTARWSEEPPWKHVVGFNNNMLRIDIVHAFHRGVGADLVAGTVIVLCDSGWHGPKGIYTSTRLTAARSGVPPRVRLCCEGRGAGMGQKGFTRARG